MPSSSAALTRAHSVIAAVVSLRDNFAVSWQQDQLFLFWLTDRQASS